MISNSVAPLRNVAALITLTERVQNRTPGLPGIAVYYGFPGYGKTTAQAYARNVFQGYSVELKDYWTKKDLINAMAAEMSITPGRTVTETADLVSRHLLLTDRPLFIDEADILVRKNMVEFVRSIYESTQSAMILIGMELLPQKLLKWEQFHGRVMAWEPAQPGCAEDVTHLAKIYARGIELDDELKAKLLVDSNHSIRRISTNLGSVAEFAKTAGIERVGLKEWGDRDFFTGTPPEPRRLKW